MPPPPSAEPLPRFRGDCRGRHLFSPLRLCFAGIVPFHFFQLTSSNPRRKASIPLFGGAVIPASFSQITYFKTDGKWLYYFL